jgi:acetyl-CoA synthase
MSQSITAGAAHGASILVDQAQQVLGKSVTEHGARAPFSYPDSAFYLPIILGKSAKTVERISDLQPAVLQARSLLSGSPTDDVPLAALFAAEALEALHCAEASLVPTNGMPPTSVRFVSPISDEQVRKWGIQLSDGRVPGIALIIGAAKNNAVAVELIQHLRRHNILCLLTGSGQGRSIIDQLQDEGLRLGTEAAILDLGSKPSSAVHALGFVARCAMKLGGYRPGNWSQILKYGKRHAPGFVLALGNASDAECAMALAAKEFGFSVVMDTAVADGQEILSAPFEALPGKNDTEKAAHLAQMCISARGLKLKSYNVNIPVAYSPAFEDELISEADSHVEFGGGENCAFELLQMAARDDVTDGQIQVIGPEPGIETHMDLGLVVKVAGRKLLEEYEPLLERQIDAFINYASGVHHAGRGDNISLRISNAAAARGFTLESIGKILTARFHEDFAAVEKIEVAVITERKALADWPSKSRQVHKTRAERLASLTDSEADVFFVCTNCRAFAPNNVSIISPERVSPCGQCNWLDAKAGYEMGTTNNVRRPIKPGKLIDARKGIWEGLNKYAQTASHGRVQEVALYSVTQSPMSACADFECIVMAIPEANGVMVLYHDDKSPTPAGVNVELFASIAAGEQIPGIEGIGKSYLLSPKFIAAEGGFRRVVWMSSLLKKTMAAELAAVGVREGDPALMDRIADERQVTSVRELVQWLKEHKHPALEMERMY